MLDAQYLEAVTDYVSTLFEQLEEYVIRDIVRRILDSVGQVITASAEWQMIRLIQMGELPDNLVSELARQMDRTQAEVEELFWETAEKSNRFDEEVFAKLGTSVPPLEEKPELKRYVEAVLKETKGALENFTQSMGFSVKENGATTFKPLAKFYQETLDFATVKIRSGTVDYTTAIREAVDTMSASGLKVVEYASGRHNQIDVAARRAVLTGISQISGRMAEQDAAELGTDLMEVTAHRGARDKGSGPENHKAWQGKVYSMSGTSTKYPSLREVTGYGTGPGLMGWNCRHDFHPFVDGISVRAYTDEELANIDPPPFTFDGKQYTAYEATQQQRKIETAIRKSKRKLIGYQEGGLEDEYTAEAIRLRRQRELYKTFSKVAGLKLQEDRMRVFGFGRGEAAKASAAARKGMVNK